MKFFKKEKGFTLIELLVVISIIGVLATIVLASFSTARFKAQDAAVISSMSSYRTQAELDYPTGDYTGLCSSISYGDIEAYVQSQGGDIEECDDGPNDYRIVSSLPSSFASTTPETAYAAGEDGYCINSLGTASKVVLKEVSGKSASITSPACVAREVAGPAYYYQYNGNRATCVDCIEAATGNIVGSGFVPQCAGATLQNGNPPTCA